MDANMIITFFKMYGWQLTVLATSGIAVLGFLKATGLFSKLNEKVKKYVYYAVSCAISIVACTAYIFIVDQFTWMNWGVLVVGIIAYTGAIYTLYENTGARLFLKKFIFTPLKNTLKKLVEKIIKGSLTQDDVKELAVGLGAEVLQGLTIEARKQELEKQKVEAEQATTVEVNGNTVAQNTVKVINAKPSVKKVTDIK